MHMDLGFSYVHRHDACVTRESLFSVRQFGPNSVTSARGVPLETRLAGNNTLLRME